MEWQKHVNVNNSFLAVTLVNCSFFLFFKLIVPDVIDSQPHSGFLLRRNFQSLVSQEVREKELLFKSQKYTPNVVKNEVLHTSKLQPTKQLPTTSAAPREFLMGDFCIYMYFLHDDLIPWWNVFCFIGFTVHIKPDVHLDEEIPICARDQHLLFNIFGDEWKSPVVISAYTAIKGHTGYMQNWLPKP